MRAVRTARLMAEREAAASPPWLGQDRARDRAEARQRNDDPRHGSVQSIPSMLVCQAPAEIPNPGQI